MSHEAHDPLPLHLPPARAVKLQGGWTGAYDLVVLGHADRVLRRRRLETVHDEAFLVDLSETAALNHGDALELADGRLIEVIAAEEPVFVVTGDLARLAWHIGNRHIPCQVCPDRLLVPQDAALAPVLSGLGASLVPALEPFAPEAAAHAPLRGAGHGRLHHHSAHSPADEDEPDEPEA